MENKKEIGFNTRCENLKNDLIENINQSRLPIAVVYFIAKGIMSEIESTYYGTLNKEALDSSVTTGTQESATVAEKGGNK